MHALPGNTLQRGGVLASARFEPPNISFPFYGALRHAAGRSPISAAGGCQSLLFVLQALARKKWSNLQRKRSTNFFKKKGLFSWDLISENPWIALPGIVPQHFSGKNRRPNRNLSSFSLFFIFQQGALLSFVIRKEGLAEFWGSALLQLMQWIAQEPLENSSKGLDVLLIIFSSCDDTIHPLVRPTLMFSYKLFTRSDVLFRRPSPNSVSLGAVLWKRKAKAASDRPPLPPEDILGWWVW